MNYIKRQKWYLELFMEFYDAYCQLDAAHKRYETTSYKGDAMKAVQKAYARLNEAKKQVEENVIIPIKQEEVKNAAG